MAVMMLQTNVPEALFTSERVKALYHVLSETSNKPESICQVSVEAGVPMEFGGSTDPTVFVKYTTLQDTRMAGDILSIGGGMNARISARLAEVFSDMLDCPKWRTYVEFEPTPGTDLGLRGSTCVELFIVPLGGIDAVEAPAAA